MLPSLTRFPPLNNDEGREANLSWVASGLQPGAERMNAYRGFPTWGTGGLQGATTVVIFHLFNLLHSPASLVFQARLTSLVWGGLLLLVVYWLGRRYWGRAVGLAATALLAVSDPFLLGSHTLRPDMQIIALVLLSLALVEYGLDSHRAWPPLLAGALLGLSFDTHMNSIGLMPPVFGALLVRCGLGVWRARTPWLVGAGVGLSAIYYALVRIVPDPGGYLAGFRYWIGLDKVIPITQPERAGGLANQIYLELLRYADYFGATRQGVEEWPELALVLFGLALASWRALRGSRADRTLLLGLLAAEVFFTIAASTKSRYYMLLTYPLYALFIARGLRQAAGRLRNPIAARAALAALVLVAVFWPLKIEERAFDKYVRASRYRAGQEYYELTAQLDRLAGPNAKILAPPLYWFGLKNHEFVDILVYERVYRQYGETADQFLEAVQPDFVITDAKIATDRAIQRDLYRALDARAPYELIVRHKNYGDVAIYRLNR